MIGQLCIDQPLYHESEHLWIKMFPLILSWGLWRCLRCNIANGNGYTNLSSNPGNALCISHSGKGMYLSILPPAKGKMSGRHGFLTMVWKTAQEMKNSKLKCVKVCFKTD